MAQVVSSPPGRAGRRASTPLLWAVDRLFAAYLAALGLLVALYFHRIPDAASLLAAHVAGILLIVAVAKTSFSRHTASHKLQNLLHHWYPLAYIPTCYKEMAVLIPAIRRTDLDAQMAWLDFRLWGVHPTVWLERLQSPWLTEFLQIAYTMFVPAVIVVAVVIWLKGLYPEFRYYAFLISLGFLASYVGYLLVPVRGPRFFLTSLQHVDLQGLWLFHALQRILNQLESAHYDCFPSGHTELTLIAWWSSRRVSRKLFAGLSVYTILIVTATVYLRYHYTVDVLAGTLLAAVLLILAPKLYVGLAAANAGSSAPRKRGYALNFD
jgi:membrane-associated phospholipid phosphatase